MSSKSSRSLRSKKEELESHSRRDILKIPIETQLQSYTDHYGVTWHGKKREFVNAPINSYDSRLDRYHAIQKARKHLKGKANE